MPRPPPPSPDSSSTPAIGWTSRPGITGSSVIGGDLIYRPDGLFLYGAHNAVTKGGGEAVCTTALQRRSDSYVTAQAMTRGTVVCMSTRDGALAELRFSAPDAHNRVQIAMTVWP